MLSALNTTDPVRFFGTKSTKLRLISLTVNETVPLAVKKFPMESGVVEASSIDPIRLKPFGRNSRVGVRVVVRRDPAWQTWKVPPVNWGEERVALAIVTMRLGGAGARVVIDRHGRRGVMLSSLTDTQGQGCLNRQGESVAAGRRGAEEVSSVDGSDRGAETLSGVNRTGGGIDRDGPTPNAARLSDSEIQCDTVDLKETADGKGRGSSTGGTTERTALSSEERSYKSLKILRISVRLRLRICAFSWGSVRCFQRFYQLLRIRATG